MSVDTQHRVPWRTVLAFGAPALGAGYMYLMLGLYVMKFSTDVLLIAPAVMGIIFSASRVWDAVSDPLVGYLSDRTRVAMGRRRSWILASIVPIGAVFYMVFVPPQGVSQAYLITWMAVGIIGYYSAMSLFFVPHMSLGAELSPNYHERSRLFGVRHGFYTFGSILSLASMQILIGAESRGREEVLATAEQLALLAIAITAVLIAYAVISLRENPNYQRTRVKSAFGAFRDVWSNHHARLLIVVTFIENVGAAAIGVLTLYVAQYVVGAPHLAPAIILSYMLPSAFSVPLWIPLSRRFGKVRLWIFSMLLTGISFGAMFGLAFLETLEARLWLIFIAAFFAGLAAGAGGTIAPSVQGDVIDYDELKTGERKEGSYFAAWNFTYKSAMGVMLLLTGFVLEFSGFVPNAEQSQTVKVAMVSLYGLLPLICYLIGSGLMLRFKLDEAAHQDIRARLDKAAADPDAVPAS